MKKQVIVFVIGILLFSCSDNTQQAKKTQLAEIGKVVVGNFQTISAQEFKAKIEQKPGLILDVRTDKEVALGMISGAKQIDYFGGFDTAIQQLNKQTTVYVYCASGGRSKKAMDKLKAAGFNEVYDLEGGITSWMANGYPVKE